MFSNNDVISIDIGSKFIKVIYGNHKNNNIKIKKYEILPTPKGAFSGGSISDKREITNALSKLMETMNLKAKEVIFGVRGSDIIARHIVLPDMPEKMVKQAVSLEIQQYLPTDKNEYVYDCKVIGKTISEGKKVQNVLMVAAPKQKVSFYYSIAEKLKLKVRGVDLYADSIAKLFSTMNLTEHNSNCIAAMDIGYESTSVTLIENGRLFFEKDIDTGIKDIDMMVAKAFAALPEEAEAIRDKTINLSTSEKDIHQTDPRIYFVNNSVRQIIDGLMDETAKVINFYLSGGFGKSISNVYIYGGGAKIKGMREYIMSFTGIKTNIVGIDLFPVIDKVDQNFKSNAELYINCISLFMRKD